MRSFLSLALPSARPTVSLPLRLLPSIRAASLTTVTPQTPPRPHKSMRSPPEKRSLARDPAPPRSITDEELATRSWVVDRTPYAQLPVYRKFKGGGTLEVVLVKKVQGNKKLMADELAADCNIDKERIRINPVTQHIEIKVCLSPWTCAGGNDLWLMASTGRLFLQDAALARAKGVLELYYFIDQRQWRCESFVGRTGRDWRVVYKQASMSPYQHSRLELGDQMYNSQAITEWETNQVVVSVYIQNPIYTGAVKKSRQANPSILTVAQCRYLSDPRILSHKPTLRLPASQEFRHAPPSRCIYIQDRASLGHE